MERCTESIVDLGARVARGALILSIGAARALAQNAMPSEGACDGKVVTSIAITPRDPSFIAVPQQLRGVARAVGLVSTTSKAATIGHFLLLSIGQPCTERQRAESERILRLQPFLADASVYAVANQMLGSPTCSRS